ncbi:MAG: hypothetical protein WBL50_16905, partial [Candidatus Acidiferrum sp.]
GAEGENRSCSIGQRAAKQEKFQPLELCFFFNAILWNKSGFGRLVNTASKNLTQFHEQKHRQSPKKTAQHWDERVRQSSGKMCR